MAATDASPRITVLAGTNGAGKSSIAGAMLRRAGARSFDPDEAARRLRGADPRLGAAEANGLAWHEGRRLLERAITERKSYTFETTLGGRTIPQLLVRATRAGLELRIFYVGLASPEQHVERVRARVARGGHDIPAETIRRRYTRSLESLVRLLPKARETEVLDNSREGDPAAGDRPHPQLLLHLRDGRIEAPPLSELGKTPSWARPVLAQAMKIYQQSEA